MRLALAAVAAAALAGCGRPDVVAEEERDAALLPEPANASSPSPTGGPPGYASVTNATVALPGSIPPALHGRWGLTPADCSAPMGDAKGLLIVTADELRFYESRAGPAANVQTSPDSISGDFGFTGEGQRWTKNQALEVEDGTLIRTERDPVASFRYVRC